jgi:hypothetical protein
LAGDTLTDIVSARPARSHTTSCFNAARITQTVAARTTEVCSMTGMNSPGGTAPSVGWSHRSSASAPTQAPLGQVDARLEDQAPLVVAFERRAEFAEEGETALVEVVVLGIENRHPARHADRAPGRAVAPAQDVEARGLPGKQRRQAERGSGHETPAARQCMVRQGAAQPVDSLFISNKTSQT